MKVRILSTAEDDLRSGFAFYEHRQTGIGAYFLECLFRDIEAFARKRGFTPWKENTTVA